MGHHISSQAVTVLVHSVISIATSDKLFRWIHLYDKLSIQFLLRFEVIFTWPFRFWPLESECDVDAIAAADPSFPCRFMKGFSSQDLWWDPLWNDGFHFPQNRSLFVSGCQQWPDGLVINDISASSAVCDKERRLSWCKARPHATTPRSRNGRSVSRMLLDITQTIFLMWKTNPSINPIIGKIGAPEWFWHVCRLFIMPLRGIHHGYLSCPRAIKSARGIRNSKFRIRISHNNHREFGENGPGNNKAGRGKMKARMQDHPYDQRH